MSPIDIIVIICCCLFGIYVIISSILKKKKGKKGCGYNCSTCCGCAHAKKQTNKEK